MLPLTEPLHYTVNLATLATIRCCSSGTPTYQSVAEPTKRDGELFGAGQEYAASECVTPFGIARAISGKLRRHSALASGDERDQPVADIVQCGLFAAT